MRELIHTATETRINAFNDCRIVWGSFCAAKENLEELKKHKIQNKESIIKTENLIAQLSARGNALKADIANAENILRELRMGYEELPTELMKF